MNTLSIQNRFVLLLNLLVIIVLSLTGYISYRQSLHEIDEVFDAQLAQSSRLTAGVIKASPELLRQTTPVVIPVAHLDELVKGQTELTERFLTGYKYESNIAIQIWRADRDLILHTANVAQFMRPLSKTGFSEYTTADGDLWINFTLRLNDLGIQIVSSQREAVREELSYHIALTQVQPILFLILPLSLLTLYIVRRGLKPLKQLQQQLANTKPEQLQPITSPMPTELTQVVAAMNQLLQAIEQHMQREKRFIADASHELRTPLSIIYLHAQNLAQSTLTDEQRHAVNAVKLGSERMTHLTNQLLALARLEQPKLDIQSLSLADLLDSSLHLLSADLLARVVWQIDTKFQQPKVAYQIRADRSLMQVAMRNILENAAKYAPFDSDVVIAVELLSMTQLQLTISNHCEVTIQLNRLGERFYRTSEHQSIAGSGLGLSIVCRIMALHHFQLDFTVIEQQFTAKIIMPFSE